MTTKVLLNSAEYVIILCKISIVISILKNIKTLILKDITSDCITMQINYYDTKIFIYMISITKLYFNGIMNVAILQRKILKLSNYPPKIKINSNFKIMNKCNRKI